MKTAYVVGLGKSGIAAAKVLQFQGYKVTVFDGGDRPALRDQQQQLASSGIKVCLGQNLDPTALLKPDTVIVSPGVPWDIPPLLQARDLGWDVIGEMGLAWRLMRSLPWVGITGTNGKTTTTALTAAIFQAAGLDAPACGNIGTAACELALDVLQGRKVDWVIAELSSYQIEAAPEIAPEIGIWTTFTPDHLSRHYTLENYFEIKSQLLTQCKYSIVNGDDPELRRQIPKRWPQACWTSVKGRTAIPANPELGVYVDQGWIMTAGRKIVPVQQLKMVGDHNQQNLLVAVAAACKAGIQPDAIAHALETFPGVPHRLEYLGTWQGVDWINDSKATNYDAAAVGLAAVEAPAILIAGGDPKAGDDQGWLQQIQVKAAAVVLIGKAAAQFAERLKGINYTSFERHETLEQAIPASARLAKNLNANVVLLSPACASFDQYPNFEARGDHFRQLCLQHFVG
ncbi:MAG: UDP-N-acetylmuramoyl-L-alanine--D-glutamate ligase [Cyanobacteria bacterium P01_H01_bin.121]